jgi:hypothetical protein
MATVAPRTGVAVAAILWVVAAQCGCGRPFNVQPKVDVPLSSRAARAQLSHATVQADVIRDEDFIHDTFDANLILAGLLPVNIRIENHGSEQLFLKSVRVDLQDDKGARQKRLNAKTAFKRLVSYYEISAYNKYGYKRSQEDFVAYEFDWNRPLGAGAGRSGLLFFAVKPADARGKLVLLLRLRGADKLEQTARLELD